MAHCFSFSCRVLGVHLADACFVRACLFLQSRWTLTRVLISGVQLLQPLSDRRQVHAAGRESAPQEGHFSLSESSSVVDQQRL